MFKPFADLKRVLEENKAAAESLMKTASKCSGEECDAPVLRMPRRLKSDFFKFKQPQHN